MPSILLRVVSEESGMFFQCFYFGRVFFHYASDFALIFIVEAGDVAIVALFELGSSLSRSSVSFFRLFSQLLLFQLRRGAV